MDFYRSSSGGYTPAWGPPTSTLNFCEVDYEFTPYVAEVFNTLTNLTYVGFGIKGLVNAQRLGEKGIGPKLPYIALINLGIASSLFHSSLKYYTQMADEFSMLIATFIVVYRFLSFSQTRFSPTVLLVSLVTLMFTVVVAQITTGESTVQQIVFTGMVYWLGHTCFKLVGKMESDESLKKKMRWMVMSSIASFVTGHAFWVTDFYACDSLRSIRSKVGMPWAALFEFHGYWHILTGLGVYIFMVLVECLRFAPTGKEKQVTGPRIADTGTWPFTVFLEKATPETDKKKN